MELLPGLLMGIVYAAAPGPIAVETLRRGLSGGVRPALAVQLGSAVGVVVYALLAILGAGLLLQEAAWRPLADLAGMALLFKLGVATIRDGRALAAVTTSRAPRAVIARRAFRTGALLSLANPMDIVFWMGIGSRVLHEPGLDGVTFLSGFFAGLIAASLVVALGAGFWQSRLTARAAQGLAWICGLTFIGFGMQLGLAVGREVVAW